MRFILRLATLIGVLAFAVNGAALAADYPDKPVRVIVAYPPGGGADIVGRLMSQKLAERVGQQFVVINNPGASGAIGAASAAHSDPDGYTLFFGQTAEMSILPNVMSNLHYDPLKDFEPIVQVSSYPYVIAVNPQLPIKTLKDFIDYAKAHPGELNYGSPGIGSSAHLAVELFARQTGIKLTHVPFRGAGPAVFAAIAGTVQVVFGDAASTTPQVVAGQLRALAVTAKERSPKLPDVATVAELGVPSYTVAAWHGFFAPHGTSPMVIKKINDEVNVILQDTALRERLAQDGIKAIGGTPDAFSNYLKSELSIWGDVAKEAGIQIK
jgi:tripartite-type tricarboxylate transporter receptor subunit TctC